jgi:hypothetical protein
MCPAGRCREHGLLVVHCRHNQPKT